MDTLRHNYMYMYSFVHVCLFIVDIGYMDKDSHHVMQLTAWIPLLDTNAHNGGMQVRCS